MEAQMLMRDPDIFPSDKVLKDALGATVYSAFDSFLGTITGDGYGLTAEWRYYNDGKAWLCKVMHKKKTVMWLSVWEGFFKASFFFTEKNLEGAAGLDISDAIKQQFALAKPVGRLISMIIEINNNGQLGDLLTVVRYKMSLK